MTNKTDILIRNGLLVAEGRSMQGDLLIREGRIAAIADHIEVDTEVEIIDA